MLLCCSEEHKSSLESFFSAPLTFSLCCFSSVLETSCWIFSLGSYRDFLRKKGTCLHALQPAMYFQDFYSKTVSILPALGSAW